MQPIKNFRNPESVKTYLAPEVTPENLDSYRKSLKPKVKRKGELPVTSYEAIKWIDWDKGLTHWKDGRVTQWSTDAPRPDLEEDEETPDWVKWRARVNSYWSTYPYRCQACGEGGQRPNNDNEGPVTLHRLDQLSGSGDERDDDLAALCTSCLNETREVAVQTEEEWELVVARFTSRHRRGEARRRRTISNQAQERRHRRARKQEWRAEIKRRIEAGITLNDPDFLAEFRDIYQSL